jgi:L-seryl-tRNA(Ser) seleniumtransferase
MFRALRVDKLTIAALEATLLAYLRGPGATAGHSAIPILNMIRASAEEIAMRADKFMQLLRSTVPVNAARFELRNSESVVGGGSTPGQQLPTRVIAIHGNKYSAAELEERLRRAPLGIPVIARVENDALLLDLRTVFPDQESVLAESLAAVLR